MKRALYLTVIALTFGLGVSFGSYSARGKGGVTPAAWEGATAEEAAANLLDQARILAGKGSWENINLGRVLYLSGDKAGAEAIFERFSSGKVEASDLIRIGRVYAHAGEWEKAKPLFDRVVSMEPKDEDWLIEVGAFYNLNGDRAYAEELFARGFRLEPKALYNTLTAAGSYAGIKPRRR